MNTGWISTAIKTAGENINKGLEAMTTILVEGEKTIRAAYESSSQNHNVSVNNKIGTNQTFVIVAGVSLAMIVFFTQYTKWAKYKYAK